ncbi:hypothetical protein EJ08DRAFT_671908 [Tothia fuscella]|uniref:Altered inheritance of mitochondria protein 9, mitochondrial n=1 Tax=Tothia fuscella TaxID=1048955 RepID=A0A9P4TV00_9PEZI|nr:hypothetical protein EJ08DRAFT_671908 [Tothia fuscella]
MLKLPEGNFNKTFLARMQDGRQIIARLPNPNAGRSQCTTASEVATMDYVRDRLNIPVPKVLAYNTQASTNGVGADYIIMEKCPGIELGRVWGDLPGKKRMEVVKQLASFTARLSKASFPAYGSLYYSKDICDVHGIPVDDTFTVGPTTSRSWLDDKRAEVDIDRGPWKSAEDVVNATMNREVACLNKFSEFPRDRQQGIFNGPGGFHPSKASKSDQDEPTRITGIIDWQGVHLSPAFLQVHYPALIEYDGPVLEGFELPQLPPDFAELDLTAKKAARELHTAQTIWGLYQIFTQKQAPDLLRTLRYRDTLPCQIMGLVGSVFDDGEVYIQWLLSQLIEPDIWKQVVPSDTPCPLVYSEEALSKQKEELAKWEKDIERKAGVITEVGAYTGWDGAISPEEFDIVSQRLKEAKSAFLNSMSESGSESLEEREK